MSRLPAALLATLLLPVATHAQVLGGGSPGGSGVIPRVSIDHWIPGRTATMEFEDVDPNALGMAALLSTASTQIPLPPFGATLFVDPVAPGAVLIGGFTPSFPTLTLGVIPPGVGAKLFLQGVVLDPGAMGQVAFTNALEMDVFDPVCAVGNSRQSANSIQLWNARTNVVTTRIGDSECGYLRFSTDRTRLFVCEPGSLRDRVEIYDLTQPGAPRVGRLLTRAGIRYGVALTRDGKKCYVPTAGGIAVHDVDPTSPTYELEIDFYFTSITGGTASIFTGPLDVALTPDGTGLYVGFGEDAPSWPSRGNVGFFDLTSPMPTEQLISVTNGGIFFSYATRHSIRVSEDGKYVYTLEFGVDPGFPFSSGFANGSLVNVIDTRVNAEVAAVPTGLSAQRELTVDRMNEWVYVPGLEPGTDLGRVVGIEVREDSPNRFTIPKNFLVDPQPYGEGMGGIAVTPDGSTLYVSALEDNLHPTPLVHVLDADTGAILAPPIIAESLPGTVGMQQR